MGLRIARLFERKTTGAANTRLSAALTRLGPTYVKLGQFLATRPDVVGPVLARDLESLQDKMAPFPQAQAETTIEDALGQPLEKIFISFGTAVAAASIAQVHHAQVISPDGPKPVAVKVLRPGIERRFAVDLAAFEFAARNAERFSAEARRLRMIDVADNLRRTCLMEMDLRLEAAALSEMAENTRNDPDFRVPAVDWDRTARTVLTLDWIDGIPLSDRARLEAAGLDLKALSHAVIQTFLRHALRDGFFHADMHPGQSVRRPDRQPRRRRLRHHGPARREGAALPRRDPLRLHHPRLPAHRRGAFRGRLCAAATFGRRLRAGDPRHRRADPQPPRRRNLDGEAVDAAVRGHRTFRYADAAGADPAAEDHGGGRGRRALARSAARHVEGGGACGARMDRAPPRPARHVEGATDGVREVGKFFGEVPSLLSRGASLVEQIDTITRDGLVLSPETVAAIGRAEARRNRWTVTALWVIAALLAVLIIVR